MNKILYIVGAGSVGGHIASNADLYDLTYQHIYFIDDDTSKLNSSFCGYDIIGDLKYLQTIKESADIVFGLAFPKIKYDLVQKISQNTNLKFPSLIASNSWISNNIVIGKGSIIYPNCSINYGTCIGDFIVMNMNCAIGHHVSIGDFTSLAPGVSIGGNTYLGKCVDVGIGASTLQGICIGNNSIIGGKAMITKSFPDNSKIVGVPARAI